MSMSRLPRSIRIRVFDVFYVTNLDQMDQSKIWLGAFGDLTMGQRYAVGLIARRHGTDTEIAQAGRFGRDIVAKPSQALHKSYNTIWESKVPSIAFETLTSQPHTSLMFIAADEAEIQDIPPASEDPDGLHIVRDWCIDKLRQKLRTRYSGIESKDTQIVASSDETFGDDRITAFAA